jgi:hypothetical protein
VLATAPPAPKPLGLDEVVETLTALHDLPELLERIEQADRAALYQALGLTVTYRRIGSTEEVKLTSTLRSVDLELVAGNSDARNFQVPGLQGVDLERVGGGTGTFSDSVRRLEACTEIVPVPAGRPHKRVVGHVPPPGSPTRA